ncbi:hypothetical protein [Nocardioides sp. LHG3406-4]|uniref:hypothetical protein n=1 Tax=Nocardioides sp. LHG3406-4 TaxID=2804575 RepID=UPI003CEE4F62
MAESRVGTTVQRVVALALLLVAGILSLPAAASVLDGQGSENLIVPAQLVAMALVGALVGYLLPGLAGDGATRRRGATMGAVVGVIMALAGVVLFFLLLNGFDGA